MNIPQRIDLNWLNLIWNFFFLSCRIDWISRIRLKKIHANMCVWNMITTFFFLLAIIDFNLYSNEKIEGQMLFELKINIPFKVFPFKQQIGKWILCLFVCFIKLCFYALWKNWFFFGCWSLFYMEMDPRFKPWILWKTTKRLFFAGFPVFFRWTFIEFYRNSSENQPEHPLMSVQPFLAKNNK